MDTARPEQEPPQWRVWCSAGLIVTVSAGCLLVGWLSTGELVAAVVSGLIQAVTSRPFSGRASTLPTTGGDADDGDVAG